LHISCFKAVSGLDSEFSNDRITRILTTDFPHYFAIVTRIRQEVHAIGPEGGIVNSTVVPQVQAIFPDGALTKKIKVGLQVRKKSKKSGEVNGLNDESKGKKRKGRLSQLGESIRKKLRKKVVHRTDEA